MKTFSRKEKASLPFSPDLKFVVSYQERGAKILRLARGAENYL